MLPPAAAAELPEVVLSPEGERVLQAFRAAADRLGIALRIVAVDSDATAPGLLCADVPVLVRLRERPRIQLDLGVGYDTTDAALKDQLTIGMMLLLIVLKVAADVQGHLKERRKATRSPS